ncbi:MAG: hypothetical protein LQ347_002915 [Umbilicaria vellea]|nr:MAG: hypothetical protein LQ347_002915 [Umbilicaria vellea]
MDRAKTAVSEFMGKAGHNDTTVHEKVAPAIVNENITKHRHEEATTAIDREIHQDHYHTSVQPIKDREVLPEKHIHQMAAVEEREQYHGDDAAIKARLEQERLQFQNTRTEGGVRESHSVAPTIAGEHVHHHVHETIQPVIQKETIQPSVVHTTIPVHEVHHNEAKHHAATALPAVSMADFKKQGGSLTGREERYDGFEGEPRAVGSALGGSSTTGLGSSSTTGTSGLTGSTGHHGHHSNTGSTTANLENKLDPRVDSTGGYNSRSTGSTGTGSSYNDSTSGTSSSTYKKPGLLDRLNPMKDTDGDGKKGVME